ncbi:hypothetical protein [Variovorax sp. 770b2]|uniref:hypothetical protein n=1 Tax=Variovorax sp. 770b2 TaxID=1566271 RepID=UPI0008E6FBE4|nr:hypothetical protein [Variovorax sp. 770b2]SFQ40703.1 hypothetical protein SAMN03159339_0348 [Variovorax sp. 770b2]
MNATRICQGLCATTFALLSLSAASQSNTGNASADYGVMLGEDSGSFFLSRQAPTAPVAVADVRGETLRAALTGELQAFVSEDSGSQWMARNAQPGVLTRAQVMSELQQEGRGFGVGWAFAEDSGSFRLSAARQPAVGVFQQSAQTDD